MDLIDKLPYFYSEGIPKVIQDSLTIERDLVNEYIKTLLNQFFIDSATYGLDYWESMLGINKNKFDIDTRRENIKAKIRGRGTTTISMIKNLCEAYSNGEVEIIMDYENYSFIIDFVGSHGVPRAFDELDKIINEIKPAHLGYSYKINYNNHGNLSNFTHEYLSKYTHDEARNATELRGNYNG